MAWIAVDKNGDEYMYENSPERNEFNRWYDVINQSFWLEVPKGTSLKLTGKQLTWDDEPFELI
jgi:hypothetical protein